MKKLFALLAVSGMAAFYACGGAEKHEENTTEQTQTEQTTTAPADSSNHAAADTTHPAEGQH